MPLWPGPSPRFGLGLWNSIAGTLIVEGAMLVGAIALYTRATRPVDRAGSIGFWSFIVISTIMWASGPWSPPPPSVPALAWFGVGAWLLVVWTEWADRHRTPRASGMA
jgi:hypothetical protein